MDILKIHAGPIRKNGEIGTSPTPSPPPRADPETRPQTTRRSSSSARASTVPTCATCALRLACSPSATTATTSTRCVSGRSLLIRSVADVSCSKDDFMKGARKLQEAKKHESESSYEAV